MTYAFIYLIPPYYIHGDIRRVVEQEQLGNEQGVLNTNNQQDG
jgi:hypothetical protein